MMKSRSENRWLDLRSRRSRLLWLVAAALALLASCGRHDAASTGHDYPLRALVRQLPDPQSPGSELFLQHEAIDGFIDRGGNVVGMDSMSMPFQLAKGVGLDGIAVGDPIEMTLHVDWQADLPVSITALRKLPAETKLEFRPARPPQG